MIIHIDPFSGFCSGVKRAIRLAEDSLEGGTTYSLGEIVHNEAEVDRLWHKGLRTIRPEELPTTGNGPIFIRAHGEPPATFRQAGELGVNIIDGTCPVVRHLQQRIAGIVREHPDYQVVICGKKNHPEVIGLEGYAEGRAVVAEGPSDLAPISYDRPIWIMAQTTQKPEVFEACVEFLKNGFLEAGRNPDELLAVQKTLCRQVSGRKPGIQTFAKTHEVVIFVGGRQSSNARTLFQNCLEANPASYFIRDETELQTAWFEQTNQVGITGATSTPPWLLEKVKQAIQALVPEDKSA